MSVNYNILDTILKKYTNNLLDNIYIFVYKFQSQSIYHDGSAGIIIYESNQIELDPLYGPLNKENVDILTMIFTKEINILLWRLLYYLKDDDIVSKYIEKNDSDEDPDNDGDFFDRYGDFDKEMYIEWRNKMIKDDIKYLDDKIICFMRNVGELTYYDDTETHIYFELNKYKYTDEKN